MASRFPFKVAVDLDGHTYTGQWELRQGGKICVGWAYGSQLAEVGRRKPEVVAKDVLSKIVKDWRRQRERDDRRLAREGQRLARTGRPWNPKAH